MAEKDNLDSEDRELMENLARAEKSRRAKALSTGALIAALLAGIGILAVLFSDTFFQPELDIAGGEEDVLAKTNDPQCRGFIERVTVVEADYRALETDVERLMTTEDIAELRSLRDRIGELRGRIDRHEVASKDARLRFDESRAELDSWFDYIDNEMSLIQDLAAWRLKELGAQPAPQSDEAEQKGADPDAGNAGADGADAGEGKGVVHVAEDRKVRPTGAARVEASDKTPRELHEGSMLAVHEAFQSFRVWHTGSLHPCGKADEGETPWSPDGNGAGTETKNEKG